MKPAKPFRIWTDPNCSNRQSTLTMRLSGLRRRAGTRPEDKEAAVEEEVEAGVAVEVAALELIMDGIRRSRLTKLTVYDLGADLFLL